MTDGDRLPDETRRVNGRVVTVSRVFISRPMQETDDEMRARVKAGKPPRMVSYIAARIER